MGIQYVYKPHQYRNACTYMCIDMRLDLEAYLLHVHVRVIMSSKSIRHCIKNSCISYREIENWKALAG